MATAAEVVTHAWTEWGIQALVLLSFTLQVTLAVLAGFRRIVDSGVLRFFTWSAYMLADMTAIYVLGHMSVPGRRSPEQEQEQELVAFWAPFLLLHLGGQDNITAYAVEDNRLWLRQLQTLAVQVAATAYVLYSSSSSVLLSTTTPLLRPAAVLVFVVSLVRYGERVWALKRASGSNSNYRSGEGLETVYFYAVGAEFAGITGGASNSEAILLIAHQLLSIPKDLLVAFVLFQLLLLRDHHARNQGSRYRSLDVGVTYALLVGAFGPGDRVGGAASLLQLDLHAPLECTLPFACACSGFSPSARPCRGPAGDEAAGHAPWASSACLACVLAAWHPAEAARLPDGWEWRTRGTCGPARRPSPSRRSDMKEPLCGVLATWDDYTGRLSCELDRISATLQAQK